MLYLSYIQTWLESKTDSDKGATMVEYGLLVALIAIVVAIGAALLGGAINELFTAAASSI